MDGVNESDENGKISNLLDLDAKNKPLNESRKTGRIWHFTQLFKFFILLNGNLVNSSLQS
ncbi:hypothetical protein Hanom_Chr09g00774571 [Helianthus anomalus]